MSKTDIHRLREAQLLQSIGIVLAEIRKERKGLTQHDLSKRTGLSQPYLSLVEKGKKPATIRTLLRICIELEVSFAEVVMEADLQLRGASEDAKAAMRFFYGRTRQ